MLGLAHPDDFLDFFSDLGLGMLFLLAGFEIKPAELIGRAGRRAGLTWLTCLGLAFALTAVTHERPQLALRTILGSNVASVGLVLGLVSDRLATRWPEHDEENPPDRPVGWRTVACWYLWASLDNTPVKE